MNLRAVATIQLDAARVTTTAAGTEVDLQKYFVSPGKREMKAVLTALIGVSSDSGSIDVKLQESATTVDSDFSDISGATFTQVTDAATPAAEAIHFFTKQRYVRTYRTLAGTSVWDVAAQLYAVKRDA